MAAGQRVQLSPGFILHQYPYRDTSALVEIFSRDYGKVGLVARGIRSPKSKWRGDVQPFKPLLLSWQLRGELGVLTDVECSRHDGPLSGTVLYSAFYLNELLMRLLERHDPHPALYDDYASTLADLREQSTIEHVLRRFEKHLLDELGYGLVLEHDAETGNEIDPEAFYDYHLESGPVAVADVGGGFVFSGKSLLSMASEEFNHPEVLQDAKRLMRAALRIYLGDKPLKTRELFKQIKL
jgi:DNA repair protein RecO (recombination protein O)